MSASQSKSSILFKKAFLNGFLKRAFENPLDRKSVAAILGKISDKNNYPEIQNKELLAKLKELDNSRIPIEESIISTILPPVGVGRSIRQDLASLASPVSIPSRIKNHAIPVTIGALADLARFVGSGFEHTLPIFSGVGAAIGALNHHQEIEKARLRLLHQYANKQNS